MVARTLLVSVNIFTDHNGIIHHNAEDQDKRKHGHHVDGSIQAGQHHERAHERNRDAQRYPESQPKAQEKHQNDKHECKPQQAILDK